LARRGCLPRLLRGADAPCAGYELVTTGHSLGAGVAALAALCLRAEFPETRCVCYAPPGGLMSAGLAEETAAWGWLSVVVGSDAVPRLSLASLERLRDDVVAAGCASAERKPCLWIRDRPRRFDAGSGGLGRERSPRAADAGSGLRADSGSMSRCPGPWTDSDGGVGNGSVFGSREASQGPMPPGCARLQRRYAAFVARLRRERQERGEGVPTALRIPGRVLHVLRRRAPRSSAGELARSVCSCLGLGAALALLRSACWCPRFVCCALWGPNPRGRDAFCATWADRGDFAELLVDVDAFRYHVPDKHAAAVRTAAAALLEERGGGIDEAIRPAVPRAAPAEGDAALTAPLFEN
jgi:hypothetical protein